MSEKQKAPSGSVSDEATEAESSSANRRTFTQTVFFSASSKDYDWRDRIKAAVSSFASGSFELEVWDDSKILAGNSWKTEIEAAITRASVAVIVLSPNYLASESALLELSRLFRQSKDSNLRLFPIVVRECDWKAVSDLNDIQMWAMGQPLGALTSEVRERELRRITENIFDLLQEAHKQSQLKGRSASESSKPELKSGSGMEQFNFSQETQSILWKGWELAKESGRLQVTLSCLLLAIADEHSPPEASRQFFRTAIENKYIGFDTALRNFLKDVNRPRVQYSQETVPTQRILSPDVSEVVAVADKISERVSSTEPIHPRHLVAALLVSEDGGIGNRIASRMTRIGIEREDLRKEFFKFLQQNSFFGDKLAGWETILAPKEPFAKRESALPDKIKLSDATRKVFAEAQRLMKESGRVRLSVSCLLFGMASEEVFGRSPTARFLRGMIDKAIVTEGYGIGLRAFLGDGDKFPHNETLTFGPFGPMDRTVASVLTRAQEILEKTSTIQTEIENRHLLAALLVNAEGNTPRPVETRLRKIELPARELREAFYDFLESRSEIDSQDKMEQWRSILAPWTSPKPVPAQSEPTTPTASAQAPVTAEESTYTSGTAGYTSEFCGVGGNHRVVDHLNMEANATRLAELIALRETQLPLAIGLFGNWGSGKSHFMNLIDQRMKTLADEERQKTSNGSGKWCREIVPIYFNAWHYLDANLWASLVSQIFESLFVHLRPKEDDLKKVQDLLEKASGAAARAVEEVALAHSATEKARNELEAAQKVAVEKKTVTDGLLKGLSSLLPNLSTEALKNQTVELLGVEKEIKTLDELRQAVEESRSLSRRLWNAMWKQPGRGLRLGWLVSTVILGPALIAIIVPYVVSLKPGIVAETRALVGSSAGVFAFLAWLLAKLKQVREGLKKLEGWQKQAEAAQLQLLETREVQTAKLEVKAAEAKERDAKLHLAEAEARERQLKEEASNLSPERRLGRFIEARAQSGDYRGQLGVVSLARRDFQALSDLFADTEALNRKVKAVEETKGEKAANELKELSKSIDRIVLFVDDLDRCQPERVVDVLQAVHLLLAFPLFAVVVGVDQRCLRQSLRLQFKGLLTSEPVSNPGNEMSRVQDRDLEERPATPLDYLEKVFHVPFHLPPMQQAGFQMMIRRLTEPQKSEISISKDSPSKTTPIQPPTDLGSASSLPTAGQTVPLGGGTISPSLAIPNSAGASLPPSGSAVNQGQVPPSAAPQVPPVPLLGSAPLHKWERDALEAYHLLVTTPRAVARLLNTYRLVRAGIPQEEWNDFKGDTRTYGEFRIVMLLLSAAAGYPAASRQWFESLRKVEDFSSLDYLKQAEAVIGWQNFQKVYQETFVGQTPNLKPELFHKWVNRVEIFAF